MTSTLALAASVLTLAALQLDPAARVVTPKAGEIDADRSQARYKVRLLLPLNAGGEFRKISGTLKKKDSEQWQISVKLDAREIDYIGPDWTARMSYSEKFLAVESHPIIRFQSEPLTEGVLSTGGEVKGKLTLRGQTRPVLFNLEAPTCDNPGYECPLQVSGLVSRRDFGMSAYRMSVRNSVEFTFSGWLKSPPKVP